MAPLPVLDIWQRFQRANGPMLEEDALKEVGLVLATKAATPDDVAANLTEAIERMVAAVQEPGPLGATNATLLLLQLVMHTFHGLKVSKRFECLDTASTSLAPALLRLLYVLAPADGSLFADTRLVIETVSFLSTILVGYQHASTLYTAHHASLLGLVETFGSHPSIVGTAVGATTSQLLVQTALCLVHVHRGCPTLNATLLKALLSHMENVPKPSAADIDATLRECSWLLASDPGYLPSIEGLWTMDEYGEVGGRSRNASSLVLSTAASCHAVPFTAALYDNGKKTIELSGAAIAPLALLQAPSTAPGPWSLEGQWRQLLADDAPNAMQPIAVAVEWACSACTVVNAASAPKCTTCGTAAPPPLPSSLQPATNGSNPAPVTASLHDTFMALQWSRGEQKGAWLARKQALKPSLQLPPASIVVPTAYTLHGDVAHCLVVEKPVSVNSHGSTTIELHVRVEATALRQVVLANGEFTLAFDPNQTLVWTYGQHVLSAPLASSGNSYHHIALVHDEHELIFLLDGAVAARTPRVKAHEDGVAAKILVLGAEPTELTPMSPPSSSTQLPASVYTLAQPMHGSIVELRVWSIALDLSTLQSRATVALSASTPHLLLYLPLVGSSEHLLMDHGPYGSHASPYMHGGWPVAPSLAALPVSAHRWGVLDGFFLYGAVRRGDSWMLDSGSAIWHSDALGLPHSDTISFQTTVATSFPAGTKASMAIALANVSYWQQTSLIDEVSALDAPTFSPPALLVHVTQHANDADVAIGLYVLKAGAMHCLSLATSLMPAIHAAQVTYDAARGTLSVALNDRMVSMVSVDVALALGLSATSALRAGLIVPHTSDIEDAVSIGIGAWHLALSPSSTVTTSALRAVYGLVGPHEVHVDDAHTSATVSCSKYHTDGSAITQELFGCQSCNTNLVFCKTCAAWCHEGHELVWKGKAAGACGCRSRGAAACHCPEPVTLPADRPVLGEPTYGLWCCPQCTVINAVDKAVCSVCGSVSPIASPTPLQDLLSPLLETPSAAAEWSCDACTMLNSASATKCTVCDTAKPGGSSGSSSTALLALASAASETMQQPSASGPWSCGACTMGNVASQTICHICGTPRPIDAVPVATPATAPASPISVATAPPPAPVSTARLDTLLSLQAQKMARVPLDLAPFATGPTTWETTAGLLVLEYAPHDAYIGDLVTGSYVDGDGSLVGLLQPLSSATAPLELRGQYKPSSTSVPNSCLFQISPQSRFDGLWFRGDGAGQWRCTFTPSTQRLRGLNGAPFYSGLVNMSQNLTNVCYQNSFLQALFMTRACRDALLSAPTSTNAVVSTLQTLFGRLLQSQSPAIATHALQRCLPPTFQAGRQQDTSDFANFIMEALSEDVSRIFGGSQASIRRCKACDHTAVTHEYFWELLLNMIELRYTPITDISGVTGTGLSIPCPLGFDRLNFDLNKDRHNAPYVYLCVKRDVQSTPITDIMIKVADVTEPKPHVPGYTRMEIDLNVGGSSSAIINLLSSPIKKGASTVEGPRPVTNSSGSGKKQVYLFYSRDPTGSPITDLSVVYGTDTVPDGFRAIRVDLNQGDGTPVYLCYRSDMPITDLKLVSEGRPGYKLLDNSLHLASTDHQYIAHTDGGHGACVTGLQLVPAADVDARKSEKWEDLGLRPAPANGAKLMLQRGHGNPLYAIEVFRAPRMVPKFSEYEVISLHAPSPGPLTIERLHGLWKAGDDCERSKRALQLHHVAPSPNPSFRVRGSFGTKGVVDGVLQWLAPSGTYVLHGHWTDATTKHPQVAHLLFRGDALEGTIGDAKTNKNVVVRGTHVSSTMTSQHPVTDLLLVRKSSIQQLPPGVSLVSTPIHADLHLAVRRDPNAPAIKDVCVVYGDIDPIPDDYVCLHTTLHGTSGNLNDGAHAVPLFICFKRDASPATAGLMDVGILSGSDVPEGYTKIGHTPLGMEANLQPGKPLFLVYKRGSSATLSFVEHPLNGEFDTSLWGPLQLVVAEALPVAYDVVGKFGFTLQGNAAANGTMRGVLYPTTVDATSFRLVGYWETTFGTHNSLSAATYSPLTPLHASTQPMELRFSLDGSIPVASGFWAQGNSDGGKWSLVADCYVHIGFKKDYGSEWANGALQTSDRVSSHALPSLLRRLVSPRTLGGDFTCGHCHARAESRVHSTIVSPPSHLILTLKRMHYDWKLQKTCKSLHDVSFPSRLALPPLDAADAAVLGATEDVPRGYGLYAVLVHSGVSANSGHYYSYCRDSSSAHLDLTDDDAAPWVKFNDTTLAVSSWAEMNQAMATSVSDSVYLLFYKRLDNSPLDTNPHEMEDEEEAKSEDEEAMLLAKAMALSMSSTQAALESLDHVRAFSPATQVLMHEIEGENAARILAARTSHVAMDDLHTVVRATSNVPEPYKSALDAALG